MSASGLRWREFWVWNDCSYCWIIGCLNEFYVKWWYFEMMHWYLWTYHLYVRLCLIVSAHNWDHCDTGIHACFPIFICYPYALHLYLYHNGLLRYSNFDYHISSLSIIHYHRTRIFSFAFSGHLLYTFQFSLFQDYLSSHDFSVFLTGFCSNLLHILSIFLTKILY